MCWLRLAILRLTCLPLQKELRAIGMIFTELSGTCKEKGISVHIEEIEN
jgi:hypothetical protein